VAAELSGVPATRLTTAWLPASGSRGFGIGDFDVNHAWLLGYGDGPPLNLTPGLGMHTWAGPRELNLPARVYDVYLDLAWRPLEVERGGLSVGATPGFYGDFTRLDSRTFQLTGWLLGNYRWSSDWSVLGGVAYVRQLRSHLLPIGGLVWMPRDDLRLELLVPKPRLVRRYESDAGGAKFWYLAGQLGGGGWAVADTPQTNVLVTYNDLRLLVGWESLRISGWQWNLEAGYVFARHIAIDGNVAASPTPTALVQFSAGF
jgi:hypothetical protein